MQRALTLSFLVAACGPTDPYPSLGSPQPLGNALTYLDRGQNDVIIVDPTGTSGPTAGRRLHRVNAGEAPLWSRSVPNPDQPGQSQLLISDPGSGSFLVMRDTSGEVETLATGVPLEAVDVSADGRWGIAYQPEGSSPSRSLLVFPNTIGILGLSVDDPSATALQLGTGGARPSAAAFSKELQLVRNVNGTDELREARVALVFVPGGLIPIDVERAVASPFVPLTPEGDRTVEPAEVLFTNNAGDAIAGEVDGVERAFVRTNFGELFVLAISMSGDTATPLRVALENVVTPEASVRDIELFFNDEGRSLLLAAAWNELILVDGFSGVAERFDAPTPVDRLVRFADPDSGEAFGLGYAAQTPELQLLRLDPNRLAERRSTAVEVLQLASPIQSVEIGPDGGRAILRYESNRDLGILDLRRGGDVLDIRFASRLKASALVDEGERLLVVADDPETDAPNLAEIRLGADFGTAQVELDQDGRDVGRVGGFVWVDHDGDAGDVTFFPEGDLQRDAAIAFRGVFLTRLIDEVAPEAEEDQ